MKNSILRAIILVAAFLAAAPTYAAPTQRPGLYGSSDSGTLVLINEATGVGSTICNLTQDATEIIYDPLAARSFQQLPNGSFEILEFDINNCAAIGAVVGDAHSFTGLEYVGTTLYGTGIDSSGGPSTLYTLNPVSGASTAIGLTAFGPISGIAYDKGTGIMYGIAGGSGPANFFRINLTTGVATVIGSTGIQAGSLRFGATGKLFAGGTGQNGGELYSINPGNGAATLVGSTGLANVTGLALVPFSPVPATSPLALLSIAATLLLFGLAALRLRRRA